MNPTLNPKIFARDLRARPEPKIPNLKGIEMKVCLNDQTRIVPIYRDQKGCYMVHRGKRVYLESYRGVLYPID